MAEWEYRTLTVVDGVYDDATPTRDFYGRLKTTKRHGLVTEVQGKTVAVEQALADLGANGWELVGVAPLPGPSNHTLNLKRQQTT